jgi:hypothetical protein
MQIRVPSLLFPDLAKAAPHLLEWNSWRGNELARDQLAKTPTRDRNFLVPRALSVTNTAFGYGLIHELGSAHYRAGFFGWPSKPRPVDY